MNFRPSGASRALAATIAVSGLLFVHAAQAQSNPNIVIAQNTQAAPPGAAASVLLMLPPYSCNPPRGANETNSGTEIPRHRRSTAG